MVRPTRQNSCGKSDNRHHASCAVKNLAGGVFEFKIDFGPGYRIYFGKDGNTVIILLGGGSKKRQSKDIEDAIFRLNDYRERKLRRK